MKTRKIWFLTFFVFAFWYLGCNQSNQTNETLPQESAEIIVSAAASLQNAFRQIAVVYEQQTRIKVNLNFASSGVLQKQIEQGAPADVFASASQEQMNQLAEKNLITPETQRAFASNNLVLIVPDKTELPSLSFAQYLEFNREKIAVGNPNTVPAGQYAAQTLKSLDLLEKLQSRFVYGEDVRQVLDYVARGEVGFGIVYASDVKTAGEKVFEIARASPQLHDPILYPIAVVKTGQNPQAAQKFVDFVLNENGQKILRENGFESIK